MHPRATRNRPLISFAPSHFYIYPNNIDSPGVTKPLLKAVFSEKNEVSSSKLFADAISCCKIPRKLIRNHGGSGLDLVCFLLEFWSGKDDSSNSVISVEVFALSHWETLLLLQLLEKSIGEKQTASIINSYRINNIDFPFNTINFLHYNFRAM